MHNPPHPGEFILETYLKPFAVSQNEMADQLGVARSTFNRLIRGDSNVSTEMAFRLSKVLGRSPASWLNMQAQYDLSVLAGQLQLDSLEQYPFPDKSDYTALPE